jgi:hydrogenase expression/formation protein HypC
MCLAIPGKIKSIAESEPLSRTGKVDFGGIVKEVSLAYVPQAKEGDYVVVHVGFAISVVDESEANTVFEYLRKMDELSELEPGSPPPDSNEQTLRQQEAGNPRL